MVNFTIKNIVGSAGETIWSQAQSVNCGDGGQLMVVVQLTCPDSDSIVDLATVGAEMIAEIERKGTAVNEEGNLAELIKEIITPIEDGLEIDILVAKRFEAKLSMYGKGMVEAYLSRNGQLAKLKDSFGEGEFMEGSLKEGDLVVLSTAKLTEVIGMDKFRTTLLEDKDPAEALAPLLHMKGESSGVAAIVGSVVPMEIPTKWPQIKLRNETPRKMNLWIGGVILLLLILMIGVGMVRRVRLIEETNFNTLNSSVESKLTETVAVGDLNPDRARSLITQAKGEVEMYLNTGAKDSYKVRARQLLVSIEEAEEKAFKKNEIQLNTLVELSILSEGLKTQKMKSDGKGNLIFLDEGGSKIIAMNLADRSRQVIDQSENFVDAQVSETKVYGLNSQGVSELFWKKDEVKKVIEPDEFWKEPSLIQTFAGNVYVFDKTQSEIWKYPVLTDGFGDRRRWLAAGITPDLTNVVDMKVVGDIWLLTSTGKLERYSRGAPVAFSMEGFPNIAEVKKFADPKAVWVTESLIYVLEAGAGRVVVFGDDGKYQSQYVNSEFSKASDLVVVDDKGYVLIDNVVKEFGL